MGIKQDRSNRAVFKLIIDEKDKPCVDCKKKYPYYVMQFDHIGTDKTGNVGKIARTSGIAAVKAEIAKCEVVCANCHAERSWQRLNMPD